ncbi:MAG: nitrate reductase subunit beta [Nitrospirae bacterium RBG_19FT_COMBO_42_15]|nr:MAG: nitrate reductase subunit beta [Nitrospirae bacterium RBG_19FT_COMBO_42_15]
MDIRAQLSMSFNLDKCIGCHTCSVSCKNIWTTRQGAEYMWWNNVETKPGAGFPLTWEDQERYRGGWEVSDGGNLRLKLIKGNKLRTLASIFFQPNLPTIDDYYEPFTYDYQNLFNAPAGDDQPVARPKSLITGDFMEKISLGPNWDDDFGGSPLYGSNDPNLKGLSESQKEMLTKFHKLFYFYVPRICNHCLNPACVAACPSGALYKRGEDGIVLIDQDTCRAWRFCVSACPYKKPYYNWATGKSEKCIFCYPRTETGQPNACAHSCVGRIRTVGALLYDAERIQEIAKLPDEKLVDGMRDIVLDPFDPKVVEAAKKAGIDGNWIAAAQNSPAYNLFKKWRLSMPNHPEFRTLPMNTYIPPLSPILHQVKADRGGLFDPEADDFFNDIDKMRIPVKFLANLLSAGNEKIVIESLKKQMAVRIYWRQKRVGDIGEKAVKSALSSSGLTPQDCEDIYRLNSLATYKERFVIPETHRESKSTVDPRTMYEKRGTVGFGTKKKELIGRQW